MKLEIPKRVKIFRTLKADNADKLRDIAYFSKKNQSQILDLLLEGYKNKDI